jgi:hypothetical protein
LPLSEQADDEVSSEFSCENLGEEVDVGDEGSLQDDWNVGGVEQSDWIWLLEASHLLAAEL